MNEEDFLKIEIAGLDPEYVKTWIRCEHVLSKDLFCNSMSSAGKIIRSRYCIKCRTPEYLINTVKELLQ